MGVSKMCGGGSGQLAAVRALYTSAALVGKAWQAKCIYSGPGTKCCVPGTWFLVYGTRCLVPGTWYAAPNTWHQEPGTRHKVPGTRGEVRIT